MTIWRTSLLGCGILCRCMATAVPTDNTMALLPLQDDLESGRY